MNLRKDHSHIELYLSSESVRVMFWTQHYFALCKTRGQWVTGLITTSLVTAVLALCLFLGYFKFCFTQLSAMDVLVRTTMKSAVNCNMCCDLQNSGNQQILDRTLRFWDIPESKPASGSWSWTSSKSFDHLALGCDCVPTQCLALQDSSGNA